MMGRIVPKTVPRNGKRPANDQGLGMLVFESLSAGGIAVFVTLTAVLVLVGSIPTSFGLSLTGVEQPEIGKRLLVGICARTDIRRRLSFGVLVLQRRGIPGNQSAAPGMTALRYVNPMNGLERPPFHRRKRWARGVYLLTI